MKEEDKAKELIEKFMPYSKKHLDKDVLSELRISVDKGKTVQEKGNKFRQAMDFSSELNAKQCALICVENEYHSLREMLFSLRSGRVIESERVYLSRLDTLNELEQKVKELIKEQ